MPAEVVADWKDGWACLPMLAAAVGVEQLWPRWPMYHLGEATGR